MKQFTLRADIKAVSPERFEDMLRDLIGVNGFLRTDYGFRVSTTMVGGSAAELNRSFFAALRRISKRITLRAGWTCDGRTEKFLNYMPTGSRVEQ